MIARKYEMRVKENRLPYLVTVGTTNITDDEKHESPQKIVDIIRYIMRSGCRKNTFI